MSLFSWGCPEPGPGKKGAAASVGVVGRGVTSPHGAEAEVAPPPTGSDAQDMRAKHLCHLCLLSKPPATVESQIRKRFPRFVGDVRQEEQSLVPFSYMCVVSSWPGNLVFQPSGWLGIRKVDFKRYDAAHGLSGDQ